MEVDLRIFVAIQEIFAIYALLLRCRKCRDLRVLRAKTNCESWAKKTEFPALAQELMNNDN